jgi:hypothetical protein
MTDDIHVHIDPSEQHVPETGPDACPKCKVPVEVGFGLAGGGYGAYTYCPQCYAILSKTQVEY